MTRLRNSGEKNFGVDGDKNKVYSDQDKNIEDDTVSGGSHNIFHDVRVWEKHVACLDSWFFGKHILLTDSENSDDTLPFDDAKQNYQTLELEISAKWKEIFRVQEEGRKLIKNPIISPLESEIIKWRLEDLADKWATLLNNLVNKGKKINDFESFSYIVHTCEKILIWTQQKLFSILGPQYDHPSQDVESLQKNFELFKREVAKKRDAVIAADEFAAKLLLQFHPESQMIANMKERVERAWIMLEQTLIMRQIELYFAHESIRLTSKNEYDIIVVWDAERIHSLFSEDFGTDITSVNILRKRHEKVESELMELGARVVVRLAGCDYLPGLHQESIQDVQAFKEPIIKAWSTIAEKVRERRYKLDNSYFIFKLSNLFEELNSWMNKMHVAITEERLPENMTGIELQIANHSARKSEINDKRALLEAAIISINGFVQWENNAIDHVLNESKLCAEKYCGLITLWECRKNIYEQFRDFHQYYNHLEIIRKEKLEKDPFCSEDEKTESLIAEKAELRLFISEQEEKMEILDDIATRVIIRNNSSIDDIFQKHILQLNDGQNLKQLMDYDQLEFLCRFNDTESNILVQT